MDPKEVERSRRNNSGLCVLRRLGVLIMLFAVGVVIVMILPGMVGMVAKIVWTAFKSGWGVF